MSLKKEFGDFQTPLPLARRILDLVLQEEREFETVIEPTCGIGAFLQAAAERLGDSPAYWGFDINEEYIETTRAALSRLGLPVNGIQNRDFYTVKWHDFVSEQRKPLLVVGNPPWVTNAQMGVMGGKNLPMKSNFQGHQGLAAKTGKANFDIAEWMLMKLVEALQGTQSTIAMLCKTSTARKVLRYAWTNELDVGPSSLHLFDASREFGVSVDACLLYMRAGSSKTACVAEVHRQLSRDEPLRAFGLVNGELVSDIAAYHELQNLQGRQYRRWRSGVKHDAAKVMEFTRKSGYLINGLGERCDLEDEYIFPLLKSSDLANGRLQPTRYVLVTQRRVSEPTQRIRDTAPKTWRYLIEHAEQLDRRGSSIYAKRPRFAVFGVGEYSFSPAKVAISGLYKNLQFQAVGSIEDKPMMVDDTCYFFPCDSISEAAFFARLLNSEAAQRFISALVFADSKRPITIDVLKRIDLRKLAELLGEAKPAKKYLVESQEAQQQMLLAFDIEDRTMA